MSEIAFQTFDTITPPAAEGARAPLRKKLEIRRLSFRYGENLALRDVSMPIYENRVTALIGPSGCGKSTLLRCLNRIYDPYPGHAAEGAIIMDDRDILSREAELWELRARIGMVFQAPAPFRMSVYDNVAFGPRNFHNHPRPVLDRAVEKALRRAALWDEVKNELGRSGLSLSGGQQQRLCIARALAVDPEVLLLDEPCSALDPGSAAKIEETILELKAELTAVIVTHNLQQAARVSDFVGFMYLGELVEFGPTEQIFLNPRDPRTQSYVKGHFG